MTGPPSDGFASPLARELAPEALERLLRYVVIDTQADPSSDSQPSTAKQLELSRMLADELRAIGARDVDLDRHGYVFATVPATTTRTVPAFGLLAHVDTTPDATGAGVRPQVVRYDGGDVALPGDPSQVLRPDDMTELREHRGHDIVTTDGTTLLGADDKAGVAEIMTAAAYLLRHPEIEHGDVRIAFTVDEEIGRGVRHFDIERFGAIAAYTVDGSSAGEIEAETFHAYGIEIVIHGHVVHPGFAKGRMVNAVKLAAALVDALPKDSMSPETTEGRDGFLHPMLVEGSAQRCTITMIARDFERPKLDGYVEHLRGLARALEECEPRARVTIDVTEQYRNMRDYLRDAPEVVARAEEAIRRVGLEPRRASARGGTDGAMLSARGLPTPNIFTGGHAYHSVREWICVHDMGAAAATLVHLAQVWAEDAP